MQASGPVITIGSGPYRKTLFDILKAVTSSDSSCMDIGRRERGGGQEPRRVWRRLEWPSEGERFRGSGRRGSRLRRSGGGVMAAASVASTSNHGGAAPLLFLMQLGMSLTNEGDAVSAYTVFTAMLLRMPTHGGARYRLGTALAARGDFSGAVEYFMAATEAEPWNGRHHFGLAATLQRHAARLKANARATVDAAAKAGPLTARQATVTAEAEGTLTPRRKARRVVTRTAKAWRRALRRGHGADPEAWFGLDVGLAYLCGSPGACWTSSPLSGR